MAIAHYYGTNEATRKECYAEMMNIIDKHESNVVTRANKLEEVQNLD